ncbi:MAG: 1-deoxy-D-xylulose-5-phosphate synthase N-terminal domain-containing protein [Gammaproteobacteria bacterium]|nr:1-deoxy-D-xylulose-5-phosphate synthase N-terminal domain-containing protein [Gammaproteobacteria bacterium]
MSVSASIRPAGFSPEKERRRILRALERKVLWLSAWTIHHANHIRPNASGIKVGGHQASSASVVTLMTALYFDVLRPEDRVAVKPHASPVFHAIQYLLGNQSLENLQKFRAMGGAQSYPSRTKDADDVDFSTGSVGLGVAMTVFASMVQDYLAGKDLLDERHRGRMIALVGDAELDEGNIYEALLEGWKHRVRNLWWVVDYNRQSLDAVVTDRLFGRFTDLFANMGWRVETIKYGKKLLNAFEKPGGGALKRWIDDCPNSLYSALVYKGGAAWREHLVADIGDSSDVRSLLDDYDDDALAGLMTNLGGHDLDSVLEAFHGVDSEQPTCFIAYTIKGFGLPFAGHKDNHAGLMNPEQMETLRQRHGVPEGREWSHDAGLDVGADEISGFLEHVPFNAHRGRRYSAPVISMPETLASPVGPGDLASTQECFGRLLTTLGRGDHQITKRIVTTSPDVTISTNLGGWVNRRGLFDRRVQEDIFKEERIASFQTWAASPAGQHIELGIAENNLFLLLAALGLSSELFGARLLPVGTVYDPFIQRGLDALNSACYQDARFILVATPSGISLAPEGGAHQSISTPLIGMGQPGLAAFEPAFGDELAGILNWAFDFLQRDGSAPLQDDWTGDADGGAIYLRLSTRPVEQPDRTLGPGDLREIIAGGYWRTTPPPEGDLAIVYSGAVAREAARAWEILNEELPGVGLLATTSADRLHAGWQGACEARRRGQTGAVAHVERLLARLSPDATLVTVIDGHPASLAWMGSVAGHRVHALGVRGFGQSGDIDALYARYGIDAAAILDACELARRSRPVAGTAPRPPRTSRGEAGSAAAARLELRCKAGGLDRLCHGLGGRLPDVPLRTVLAFIVARVLSHHGAGLGLATGTDSCRSDVHLALMGDEHDGIRVIRHAGEKGLAEIAALVGSETTEPDSSHGGGNVALVVHEAVAGERAPAGFDARRIPVLVADATAGTGDLALALHFEPALVSRAAAAEILDRLRAAVEDPRRLLL